jgi:hypothetical protein
VTLIAAENNYDVVSVGGILTVAVTDCEIIPTRWVNESTEVSEILADTNELQGLISDSKIASQVKGMDADVLTASALKADAINEITAAIWAKVVDGTITFATMSKILLAFTAGKVIITANSFAFYDQSNVLLFTLPITTAGRIPVIA